MEDIINEIKKCNVSYNILGKSDRSAMPLGNGELCASIWTNEEGEICFYMSRSDALTELDRTVKLGMIKVKFEPNPFINGQFCQKLDVADGYIAFQGKGADLIFCIPPNENQIILQGSFAERTTVTAEYINWRKKPHQLSGGFYTPNNCSIVETPDVVERLEDGIFFYHRNGESILKDTARCQEVNPDILPDLLKERIFGGCLRIDGGKYKKQSAVKEHTKSFCLHISTESMQGSLNQFEQRLQESKISRERDCLAECREYWNAYWRKSYIIVKNDQPAKTEIESSLYSCIEEPLEYQIECKSPVTAAYVLTRFMMKCCAEGEMPILYNGMLFNLCPGAKQHFHTQNFGETCTAIPEELTEDNNPDERSWCIEQLWQNIRHPYHTFLVQGERQPYKTLFSYYRRFWKLNRYRAQKYYGAEGQHNTEMTLSFGLQSNSIYGENRDGMKTGYAQNRHGGAVDISPGLELLHLMLDYYDYTKDSKFFHSDIQIYGKELYRYIETRFLKRENGKIVIEPLNVLETYRDAKNPVTVTAGLKSTIARLLKAKDLQEPYRAYFTEYANKIPPIAKKVENEQEYLQPAEEFQPEKMNVEIPELYACFPFDLYNQYHDSGGIMKRTFEKRTAESGCSQYFILGKKPDHPSYSGWQYQGIVAAKLGMTEFAEKILSENVQLKNPGTRFPAMWGPVYDGVPDTDHGANIVHLLQQMVLQTEGGEIHILPAFPKEWDVSFKLHVDKDWAVEAEYENGCLKKCEIQNKTDTQTGK